MLAISVEEQVLTDFIYGCVSQKFGRNFSELVSSASALCSSVQLRVEAQVSELAVETFMSCDREKRKIKTTWAALQKG